VEEVRVWDDLAAAALKYFPRGIPNQTLETWLLRYEAGVTPSASQVAAAWQGFRELAPTLPDYCSGNVLQVVAANLNVAPDELTSAMARLAADLGMDGLVLLCYFGGGRPL
jgi:hypothetical protein